LNWRYKEVEIAVMNYATYNQKLGMVMKGSR